MNMNDKVDMYKINGIEYFKEGFLELEPLLYYDDYQIDYKHDKDAFDA